VPIRLEGSGGIEHADNDVALGKGAIMLLPAEAVTMLEAALPEST
jgi:hypothetical protein